jgi:hypothetical protein
MTSFNGGGASGPSQASDAGAMAGGRSGAYGAGPMSSAAGAGLASSGGGNSGPPGAGPGGSRASNAGGLAGSGGATPSGPVLGSAGGNTPPGRATNGAPREASGNLGADTASGGNLSGGPASAGAGRPSPAGGTPGGAGGGGAFAPSQAGGTPVPNLPFGQAGSNDSTSSSANSGAASGSKSASSKSGRSRGRNWALTEAKAHSIGVTRPLHVAVHADRLLIVPDRGDSRPPVVVPIAPELRPEDVNQFVTAVQREVKGWGLAVANGYWKPVLHMGVAPGAERQFAELQTALEGSGFDILRR